ncbi:2-oxoacid dehydrogenases acyltransferase-domain-containing protein [Mycena rebaudengoi]|nr:2-oxoacid dehydrogenases acyltransferase-domain-containing protein [Mycena rebaudengoi]
MLLPRLRVRLRFPLQFHSAFHTSPLLQRKVAHTFKLADIGEGITECEVIRWSVSASPPSALSAFDPLCEVQSDKASVEITSPWDGVVKEILVQEGEVAKVGQGLCVIEVEEEDAVGQEMEAVEAKTAPASPPTAKAESTPPSPPPPARRLHPLDPAFSGNKQGAAVSDVDTLATPSVRHYARTQGVDLAQIAPGTGRGGRVERADVDAFLAAGASSSEGSAPSAPRNEKDVLVELGRTRQAMWRAMEKSLEIPHFGYSATLDITELHALLPLLNANIPPHYLPSSSTDTSPARLSPAEQSALSLGLPLPTPAVPAAARYTRLTYLPFLLKSLAHAMMDWPLFRASIAPAPSPSNSSTPKSTSRHLTIRPHADIALALSTPSGLYTPVLRAVDTCTPYALASQIAELAALGRAVPPALTPKHLAGGATLTVSNVGSAGRGRWASPVLVPGGGVAIVALGRAEWVWDVSGEYPRACAEGDSGYGDGYGAFEGQRRLKLNVSWAADHRVVEGAEMAAFVESWRGWVEAPGRALGEGV